MKTIAAKKEHLTEELRKGVCFFHIAEGGAMGVPGGVLFATERGRWYEANYLTGEITEGDLRAFFPVLEGCRFGMFGIDVTVPEGWRYVNLGMGNHLLVREDFYPAFQGETEGLSSPAEFYRAWQGAARRVLKKILPEKKGNGVTEIVFILDKSGSMAGFEGDTVGGFNAAIEKQKGEEGRALISTVLFSDTATVLHDRVEVQSVPPLTQKEYRVGGCTALLDALGGAIHHIGNIHKYAREEDVPEHTVFVITTDGMENASVNYDSHRVKEMIQRQQDRYGWEFIFVAANIDAVETAARYGIRKNRAVNYEQSEEGVEQSYRMMSQAISAVRDCRSLEDESWKKVSATNAENTGATTDRKAGKKVSKTPATPKK